MHPEEDRTQAVLQADQPFGTRSLVDSMLPEVIGVGEDAMGPLLQQAHNKRITRWTPRVCSKNIPQDGNRIPFARAASMLLGLRKREVNKEH